MEISRRLWLLEMTELGALPLIFEKIRKDFINIPYDGLISGHVIDRRGRVVEADGATI
jgi:hypothetical protein